MIEPGRYEEIVVVTRGRHRGRIGYYDDDEGDDGAIVYFGPPLLGEYHVISYSALRYATLSEREQFKVEKLNDIAIRRAYRDVTEPKQ